MPAKPRPGVMARVQAEKRARCQQCHGAGHYWTYGKGEVVCRSCDGTGRWHGWSPPEQTGRR